MIDTAAKVVPIALILVPTRELAMQVSEAIFRYGRELGVKVMPIYGGQPIFRQLQALDRGVHVVVATPGRALDHIGRGSLPLDAIKMVVLDEADEMLDMGFADDIESILQATPEERQTVLFSATMPPRINAIARQVPARPGAHPDRSRRHHSRARRSFARAPTWCSARTRPPRSGASSTSRRPKAALVFCRTRTEVDQLTETMNGRGYRAEALHGGMDQPQRDRVMGRLRDGTAELLVATDVAARGLDVDTLTHVVNYDVPSARRELRPPHRSRRPRRSPGRGDHARRAARAAAAVQHREAHQAEDRDRAGADRRRPARPPDRADGHTPSARRSPPTISTTTTTSSTRWPAITTCAPSRSPR